METNLQTKISELHKIGKVLAKKFNKLGLHTVADLLFYYPFRYDDFSNIISIANLKIDSQITIKGTINLIANKRAWRKRMYITECLVSDATGTIKIVWFNQPFITKILKQGDTAYFSGTIEQNAYGLQLISPSYEKIKKEQTHTARIIPAYSLTENLTAKQIRYLIKMVLPLSDQIIDWVPKDIINKYNLISLKQAISEVHFPTNKKTLFQARHRLKFNELLLVQLQTESIRQKINRQKSPIIKFDRAFTKKFVDSLPFRLTNSQKETSWQILRDLEKNRPMNRLLEGDVGSGKTVVAALAMLNVANNKFQAALMAPTEILAQQHFHTISKLFSNLGINIALLTRTDKKINAKKATPKKITAQIGNGKIQIIIGTHAIIQQAISFNNLGLVIIDEQHRFGVDQRKILKQKAKNKMEVPHLLSMTATPIPRSLALTLYGDLDLSIITEMPKNRKKVWTKIVPPDKRQLAYNFIQKEVLNGRQVFMVCPLIEESDKLGVKAATAVYNKLKKEVFPDLTIGLLHGKLKTDEKQKTMAQFINNKTNILVATSVIEVGVDIPNASVMMIEGADRFGLAQLHQFRGRVGRAQHQSYCFVFTDSSSAKTATRLQALITSKNGFELAEKDLEFRGPGEIYGLAQSGFPDLKIATLTDYQLIQHTKTAATQIFEAEPRLNHFPLIKEKLKKFAQNIHLE